MITWITKICQTLASEWVTCFRVKFPDWSALLLRKASSPSLEASSSTSCSSSWQPPRTTSGTALVASSSSNVHQHQRKDHKIFEESGWRCCCYYDHHGDEASKNWEKDAHNQKPNHGGQQEGQASTEMSGKRRRSVEPETNGWTGTTA